MATRRTSLHPRGTPGRHRVFTSRTPISTTWTSRGKHWDNYWGAVQATFSAYIRATAGTIRARLYNVTAAAAVTNSEVSTTSATADLITSTPSTGFTLVDGDTYQAQTGVDTGATGEWHGCSVEEV